MDVQHHECNLITLAGFTPMPKIKMCHVLQVRLVECTNMKAKAELQCQEAQASLAAAQSSYRKHIAALKSPRLMQQACLQEGVENAGQTMHKKAKNEMSAETLLFHCWSTSASESASDD